MVEEDHSAVVLADRTRVQLRVGGTFSVLEYTMFRTYEMSVFGSSDGPTSCHNKL